MSKILKTHPKSVQSHKDLILACLDDKDESIRLRALDLLHGMVSKKNLMEIVKRLLGHMERAEGSAYRDELLYKVIEICSQSSYLYVTNFEWYLTVLVELIQLEAGSKHGRLIAEQLLDVAIRVPVVRQFAVIEMSNLLDTFVISSQSNSIYEVLYAAAWIVGEFASDSEDLERTLNILLRPRPVPGHIQSVFVQNVLKLFTRLVTSYLENEDSMKIIRLCDHVFEKLEDFSISSDIEVQERANSACILIKMLRAEFDKTTSDYNHYNALVVEDMIKENIELKVETNSKIKITKQAIEIVQEMVLLFTGELIPVAPKAQRKVPLPDGLDLDEWINAPLPENEDNSSLHEEKDGIFFNYGNKNDEEEKLRNFEDLSPEQIEKNRLARIIEQSNNPHYLKSSPTATINKKLDADNNTSFNEYDNIDDIPITELSLDVPLQISGTKRSDKYLLKQHKSEGKVKKKHKKPNKSKKSKNKVSYSDSDSDDPKPLHVVNTTLDMPEGVALSDTDEKDVKYDPDDIAHRALDIELDLPELDNSRKRFEKKSTSGGNDKKISKHSKELQHLKSEKSKTSSNKKEKKKSNDKVKDKESKSNIKLNANSTNLLGTLLDDVQNVEASSVALTETTNDTQLKKKSKKKSSEKEKSIGDPIEKAKKSKHHHKKLKKELKHLSSTKEDYEEALGISTPSKEII